MTQQPLKSAKPAPHWKIQASKVTSGLAVLLRESTSKWFGVFWLSLFMTYLVGLSVENYWQALPTLPGQAQREAFLPKPFVNDGADLGRLQQIATRPDFLIALILCLSVQTVQANGLRARKGTIVKSGDGRSFGLLKSKAKGSLGLLMLTLYGIDIYTGWVNFPLIGVAAAVVPINAFWLLLSIFGAELVGNAIICMLEEIKSDE